MYQDYFGLNSKPFGIVPDTRFLFLSDSHREAIAHLVYALNEKNGFVQLTGEVGVGKTMACRYILANIPKDIDVALILNPRVNEIGLLRMLCQEMKIKYDKTLQPNELTQLLNDKLLEAHAANRHTILIIDEAQNLPKRTLEQLRLLTNLETDTQKLLRIILIGQPELGELLAEYDMRQVAQRITSRYHLCTLGADETDDYIHHRLKVAGCERRLFSKAACRSAYKLTEGTPRLLNLLCDRALIAAYSKGESDISASLIKKAAKEALPRIKVEAVDSNQIWMSALLLLVTLLGLALYFQPQWRAQLMQTWQPAKPINASVLPTPRPAPISQAVPQSDTPTPAPATDTKQKKSAHPDGISQQQLNDMKKQADIDFRLGIPTTIDPAIE